MNADINILKQDVDSAINRLMEKRRENKKKAEYTIVGGATISAVTTISIGFSSLVDDYSFFFQGVALIFSASLTILIAWDGFYNHKRLWLLQADIVNRLNDIKTDIKHIEAKGDQLQQDNINQLYTRYKAAFKEFNEQWKDLRADNNTPQDKAK